MHKDKKWDKCNKKDMKRKKREGMFVVDSFALKLWKNAYF
jgi:hypothetical protein